MLVSIMIKGKVLLLCSDFEGWVFENIILQKFLILKGMRRLYSALCFLPSWQDHQQCCSPPKGIVFLNLQVIDVSDDMIYMLGNIRVDINHVNDN